jgi:streptogramin lyase
MIRETAAATPSDTRAEEPVVLSVRVRGSSGAIVLALAVLLVLAGSSRASPVGTITEFGTGLSPSEPNDLASGPGGDVWFTDIGSDAVGQVTPNGVIAEFRSGLSPESARLCCGIVAGPDGNLWFADRWARAIGRITPGGMITEFSTGLRSCLYPIPCYVELPVAGPDGNVWFTDGGSATSIGRITPSGTITEFSAGLPPKSFPDGLVAGPDGNLWFTDNHEGGSAVGRISPSGTITEFSAGLNPGSEPFQLVSGPDGNVWFTTRNGAPAIGRITPSGTITEYSAGLPPASLPHGIIAGPDGNLWFGDAGNVGRITRSGEIIEFSAGLNPGSRPYQLVSAPDTNVWFTDDGTTPAIGRVTPSGTITEFSAGLNPRSLPYAIVAGPDGNLWFADGAAIGRITLTEASPVVSANALAPTMTLPPTITAAHQSASTWREGSKLAQVSKRKRPPVGTTFSFTLNEQASVSFEFTQQVGGRRVNGKCIAQTKKNRRKGACKRTVTRGTLSFTGRGGANKVVFQGRISRSKKLKPGRYTLIIAATNSAGARSTPASLSFTIVK